jgi:hypothetical protein
MIIFAQSPKKTAMSAGKKILKFFLWIFIIILIGAGGLAAWLYFGKSGERNAMSVVPSDAIFIIETKNLTKGWDKVSSSNMWKHLMGSEKFADINESAQSLDSLINGNETLDMLFSGRQLIISAHMISDSDYDFLFAVDLRKASKVSYVKDYLGSIAKQFGYSQAKREFKGADILELSDLTSGEIISITFIENIFVCSFSSSIIEKAIEEKDSGYWLSHPPFRLVADDIKSGSLFNFYINFSQLASYIRTFTAEDSPLIKSLQSALLFSAFNFDFESEKLSLDGYMAVNDSVPSYFLALAGLSPGKTTAHEIISSRAAIYLSMAFDDSEDFFIKLREVFAAEDSAASANYDLMLKKLEKALKINVQKDLLSWIGNEIAFVKLEPGANIREQDALAIIHSRDINAAKAGLEKITKQVKKRSLGLVKFEDHEYKNFTIRYLNYSGLLKLLFGKLFKDFDKPYYVYMDDFVVFSNSPSVLMDFIDDYSAGKTLVRDESYMSFRSNLSGKSNINAYVSMPRIYRHLYFYSKPQKRNGIRDNKEVILGFTRIGFQLTTTDKEKKIFKATLIGDFDEAAAINDELEKLEAAAEELFIFDLDTSGLLPSPDPSQLSKDGALKLHHADSTTVRCEGRVVSGAMQGLWRIYYENGRIAGTVNYVDGKPSGVAMFYYNETTQITLAQFEYKDGLVSGKYREFYSNGQRKAELNFKDGLPDGDAEFYYDSGVLKIEGQYKEGVKSGKWKHFTETGEMIDKEKWKKEKKKKK